MPHQRAEQLEITAAIAFSLLNDVTYDCGGRCQWTADGSSHETRAGSLAARIRGKDRLTMNREERAAQLKEVAHQLRDGGVEFIQIEMPDINGCLRGKVVPLDKGVSPYGTDLSSLTFSLRGGEEITLTPWANEANGFPKVTAVPDPTTIQQWPWRPSIASLVCDWFMADGSACPLDGRQVLRRVAGELAALGFEARASCEFEIYIFKSDPQALAHGEYRSLAPWGRQMDCYSLARNDGYLDFATEFMRRLQGVGIPVEAFHTEYGFGMNEFTSAHQPAVKAADDAARSKLYLCQLCNERDLVATFMPVPGTADANSLAGCHHNISLWRGGQNALWDPQTSSLSAVGRQFVAGMLRTMRDFHVFFRPWVNSHRRVDRASWNPDDTSWGIDNHVAAVRVVHGSRPEKYTRFEHRAPGPDVNFYLSLAAMLWGGLEGIKERLEPPEPAIGDPGDRFEALPKTLEQSIDAFSRSDSARALLGDAFMEHFIAFKNDEAQAYRSWLKETDTDPEAGVTQWEYTHYFEWA